MRAIILFVCLAFLSESALADTFKCDAVNDLARLGYSGSEKVSIVGEKKVCKFSIGGASADGMEAPSDSQTEIVDFEVLRTDRSSFISSRLAGAIIRSARSLGDPAEFVLSELKDGENFSDLACDDSNPTVVGALRIRCIALENAKPNSPQSFENGVVTAVLFQPRLIFEIVNDQTGDATMLIFFALE